MKKCIFVDVDETLICFKSMASFLLFYLTDQGYSEIQKNNIVNNLVGLTLANKRSEANHEYFKLFSGISATYLMQLGEEWFSTLDKSNLFIRDVLSDIEPKRDHASLILVSGAFCACLNPIANYISADDIICTELDKVDDKLTGKVMRQMLGYTKSMAIKDFAYKNDIDLSSSYAYADDVSDIAMLESVGISTLIIHDNNSDLFKIAANNKYNVIHINSSSL